MGAATEDFWSSLGWGDDDERGGWWGGGAGGHHKGYELDQRCGVARVFYAPQARKTHF